MALRDWPLWSAATTGRDALRNGSMRSSTPTDNGGTGLGPVPGVVIVDYSAMSRYRKVTTCSRVQVSEGLNLPGSVPLVMPLATAQATESAK